VQVVAAQAWAAREFAGVRLGDKRLTRRAVAVAAAMAAAMAGDPSASIPGQNKTWARAKGAYRLFAITNKRRWRR